MFDITAVWLFYVDDSLNKLYPKAYSCHLRLLFSSLSCSWFTRFPSLPPSIPRFPSSFNYVLTSRFLPLVLLFSFWSLNFRHVNIISLLHILGGQDKNCKQNGVCTWYSCQNVFYINIKSHPIETCIIFNSVIFYS